MLAMEIGMIFLAVAAIDVAYPHALDLASRAGRARSGRAAVLAALTAIAVAVIYRVSLELIASHFPSMMSIDLHVTNDVAWPLPGLFDIAQALVRAIEVSALAGLFLYTLRVFDKAKWLPDAAGIAIIFFISVDSNASTRQLPMMFLTALIGSLVTWVVVRYIIGRNLLAYPLVIAIVSLLSDAATLLHNHRPDLIVNGVAMLVACVALIAWVVTPAEADAHA
jgi:hypothetical protein